MEEGKSVIVNTLMATSAPVYVYVCATTTYRLARVCLDRESGNLSGCTGLPKNFQHLFRYYLSLHSPESRPLYYIIS